MSSSSSRFRRCYPARALSSDIEYWQTEEVALRPGPASFTEGTSQGRYLARGGSGLTEQKQQIAWAKDAKRAAAQINARDVTVARLPAFREAFERRRCVIPADGFFEWTGTKETRLPHWYHRSDGRLLLFAGLRESWQPSPDKWERTFTIITTAANAVGSPVHDRMPAILEDEAVEEWLYAGSERESLLRLIQPAPADLLLDTAVSQRVNSVKNDDPDCLAEIARLS